MNPIVIYSYFVKFFVGTYLYPKIFLVIPTGVRLLRPIILNFVSNCGLMVRR